MGRAGGRSYGRSSEYKRGKAGEKEKEKEKEKEREKKKKGRRKKDAAMLRQ